MKESHIFETMWKIESKNKKMNSEVEDVDVQRYPPPTPIKILGSCPGE